MRVWELYGGWVGEHLFLLVCIHYLSDGLIWNERER